MLTFQKTTFEESSDLEWLFANGVGGYASSSLSGANTRRYHGLLVAALQPPAGRTVMVSKVEESIAFGRDTRVGLSSNRYPGAIHPEGYLYLHAFERTPIPAFHYRLGEHALIKRVFMVQGSNTTVLEYENTGETSFQLLLEPLFVHRDYHSLFTESAYFDYYADWKSERRAAVYAHYGAPALHFSFSDGRFFPRATWFKSFEYGKEKYRGLDYREDARSLGMVSCELAPGARVYLTFSTEEEYALADAGVLKADELRRIKQARLPHGGDPFFTDLAEAAGQFIVWRQSSGSHSLIAGYHWFTDWGRDTMIAMRGICIALGKQEMAKSILETFLRYIDGGMLPNRFPDRGEQPEYNTIDATLWLFVALYEYYLKFKDFDFIRKVLPDLTRILDAHVAGVRYNIHTLPEGLLFGGEGLSQLTWMDAKVGDYVVTPRHGCPVEINALWYNALMIWCTFTRLAGEDALRYETLAGKVKAQFKKHFFNEQGFLYDVVIPGEYADESIRPNQIYALSLPYALLSHSEEKEVLDTVKKHLYTGLGLRTLSPGHPDFKPLYGGDQWQRDTAYHQGTVWPFLLGEYWLAYLKWHRYSEKAKKEVRNMMEPLRRHFYESGCIHGIAEIFDGETPGPGRGCVHQAWSVGMLLKVLAVLDDKRKGEAADIAGHTHEAAISMFYTNRFTGRSSQLFSGG